MKNKIEQTIEILSKQKKNLKDRITKTEITTKKAKELKKEILKLKIEIEKEEK